MTQKRFVVRRVGSEYVAEPVPLNLNREDFGTAVVGGVLALAGLKRRSLLGLGIGAAGAALAYEGLTGHSVFGKLLRKLRRRIPHGDTRGPSFPGERDNAAQTPEDVVDEASMESFPASDPPSV